MAARLRLFVRNKIIFNTEELATVYHIPSMVLEAPKFQSDGQESRAPGGVPTI